jgi:glycogen operon protein
LFNAHYEPLPFKLPEEKWGKKWSAVLDTNGSFDTNGEHFYAPGDEVEVESRSLAVLRRAE